MQLRGINFGHVFCSSGARNFTGTGWSYHRLLRPFGLRYRGSTLITKTVTLNPRAGNMPLLEDGLTPRDRRPDCVIAKPWKGVALNAVGLSNFGALWLLTHPDLRAMTEPFLISFMPVESTATDRFHETFLFTQLMRQALECRTFNTRIGLQMNLSCPNTQHGQEALLEETPMLLNVLQDLGIPLICKFNVLVEPETAAKIAAHPGCDAISVSNTIPWGKLPERIDWVGLFGVKDTSPESSPLAKYGGGGLSGAPLLPLVEEWITAARPLIQKPIMGGGGILCKKDAARLFNAGANAIELGSISMLRPWRVQGVIHFANNRFAIERRSS